MERSPAGRAWLSDRLSAFPNGAVRFAPCLALFGAAALGQPDAAAAPSAAPRSDHLASRLANRLDASPHQERPPRPSPPSGEAERRPPSGGATAETTPLDDHATATRRLREVEKGLAEREPRLRAAALAPFLAHSHESYVKRLAVALKDKHDDVAIEAAKALANQPFAVTTEALLDFACNDKNLAARPEVCAEAIRGLGRVGLGKKGFDRLREKFAQGDAGVKSAICLAFAAVKEKRAFSFLVDQYDAPAPENPDSAANPPESYWRARHEEWSKYSMHARKALKELTGEKFVTTKEWKEWAAGPGKELGFSYAKER